MAKQSGAGRSHPCLAGCACGKHTVRNSGQFVPSDPRFSRPCFEGCACGRHDGNARGFKHSDEARLRIGAASRSRQRYPLTDVQKARISDRTREAMARPEVRQHIRDGMVAAVARPSYREQRSRLTAAMVAAGAFQGPTKPQLVLRDLIESAGYRTALEVQFDRAVVDIYLPIQHIAIEADGVFWHGVVEKNRPGYYGRRDLFLMNRFNLPTVRFTDAQIEHLTVSEVKEVIANVEV